MQLQDTKRIATGEVGLGIDNEGANDFILDPLTRVFSKTFFDVWFERELRRAKRYRRKTAMAMVAVDRMARWNQLVGQSTGDAILAEIASILQSQVRLSDIVSRRAGDTFAIALPETNVFFAHDVAEKLCRAVREDDWRRLVGFDEPVTVSIGVVGVDPSRPMDEAFARCKQNLDRARTTGRNRVFAC